MPGPADASPAQRSALLDIAMLNIQHKTRPRLRIKVPPCDRRTVMKKVISLAFTFIVLIGWGLGGTAQQSADSPVFTASGELVLPNAYREWVFLGTGLGMTYGPAKRPD